MKSALQDEIELILGQSIEHITPLGGGMIGQVARVKMADGSQLVAKTSGKEQASLDHEGYMLRYLAANSQLPLPEVLYSSDHLLLMTFVEGSSRFSASTERHAAELLADLHSIRGPNGFGLERDTLIGPLHQPNTWAASWVSFFREQRLLYMANVAAQSGQLPATHLTRLEKFSAQVGKWLLEPEQPSLIHGDIWATNVLAAGERITAFLDPAIYHAHAEMELAYIRLFNTFGDSFFRRYNELRPIQPGFFETRCHIYNLYPLLVHVHLFGGGYVSSVDRILQRFGF